MEEKFRAGDIVFVRTTGEAVTVLKILDGGLIDVRRASQGQTGIEHHRDTFECFELETQAEKNESDIRRQLNEFQQMTKMQDMVQAASNKPEKPALVN